MLQLFRQRVPFKGWASLGFYTGNNEAIFEFLERRFIEDASNISRRKTIRELITADVFMEEP